MHGLSRRAKVILMLVTCLAAIALIVFAVVLSAQEIMSIFR